MKYTSSQSEHFDGEGALAMQGTRRDKLEQELIGIRKLAKVLDSQFPLPGGFSIGLDGLIGLIPGIGDLIGGSLSLWLIAKATRYDISKLKVARMLWNVGVDSVIGAVPLVGDLFDFAWKANAKNIRILEKHLEKELDRELKSSDINSL